MSESTNVRCPLCNGNGGTMWPADLYCAKHRPAASLGEPAERPTDTDGKRWRALDQAVLDATGASRTPAFIDQPKAIRDETPGTIGKLSREDAAQFDATILTGCVPHSPSSARVSEDAPGDERQEEADTPARGTMEDRIAEIKARLGGVSAGPWFVWDGHGYVGGGRDLCIGAGPTWLANMDHRECTHRAMHMTAAELVQQAERFAQGYEQCAPDADIRIMSISGTCTLAEPFTDEEIANANFIARAREDVPFLLAAIDYLDKALDESHEEADRLRDHEESDRVEANLVAELTALRADRDRLGEELEKERARNCSECGDRLSRSHLCYSCLFDRLRSLKESLSSSPSTVTLEKP